jgi:hypothetical protein
MHGSSLVGASPFRSAWRDVRDASLRGRVVVAAVIYAYFLDLIARGGHLAWGWFEVPATTPSFLDLRSVTSGWDCARRGIAVIARNPCDPQQRPANYPRLWMWPWHLGLGQGSTLILGLLLAVVFFGAAFFLMGPIRSVLEALVWSAVLTSPAVMLGVERGNADLFVFAVIVAALALLRSHRAVVRAVSHALFLAAAVLKLFPVFAFVVLIRQSRRWVVVGGGLVLVCFAAYALATLDDIRTIERVLPQETYYSFGSDVAVRAVTSWLGAHWSGLAFLTHRGPERTVRWACVGLATIGAVVVARRWRPPATCVATRREVDGFVIGTAIFAFSFVLEHNFDYRLLSLLFAVPALLRWSRGSQLAVLTAAALVAALWVSEWLSGWYFDQPYPLPYDELVNWLLFGLLVGMTAALTRPYWSRAALREAMTMGAGGFEPP